MLGSMVAGPSFVRFAPQVPGAARALVVGFRCQPFRFSSMDTMGSPVFLGCPFLFVRQGLRPRLAPLTLPFNGVWVSSLAILVTQDPAKIKDAMELGTFRGSILGFELAAYASCRPYGEHGHPLDFGVTTMQGSLPVARLHALPPGIWTRLGLL